MGIAAAVRAERDRCARLAEDIATKAGGDRDTEDELASAYSAGAYNAAREIAAAIRSRKLVEDIGKPPGCGTFMPFGPPWYATGCRKPKGHEGDCDFGTKEEAYAAYLEQVDGWVDEVVEKAKRGE